MEKGKFRNLRNNLYWLFIDVFYLISLINLIIGGIIIILPFLPFYLIGLIISSIVFWVINDRSLYECFKLPESFSFALILDIIFMILFIEFLKIDMQEVSGVLYFLGFMFELLISGLIFTGLLEFKKENNKIRFLKKD